MRIAATGMLMVLLGVACGGASGDNVVRVDASFEPRRVAIRTLEPGATPTPTPEPTPTPTPAPTPTPVPPPQKVTITSAAGMQEGAPDSFCWSQQVGGRAECHDQPEPEQPEPLVVRRGEAVKVRITAQIAPDDESIRPFQGTRTGYPSQSIDPALRTNLTLDLPQGLWSMDLCATWAGRGDSICWLFRFDVQPTNG